MLQQVKAVVVITAVDYVSNHLLLVTTLVLCQICLIVNLFERRVCLCVAPILIRRRCGGVNAVNNLNTVLFARGASQARSASSEH